MCAGASGIRSRILADSLLEHPAQNLALPWPNYPVAWLESKQELHSESVHVCLRERERDNLEVEKGCGQLVFSDCKTDILNQRGP